MSRVKCGDLNGPHLLGDRTGFSWEKLLRMEQTLGRGLGPSCGGEASRFPVKGVLNLSLTPQPSPHGRPSHPGFCPLTPVPRPWAVWWSGRAQQDDRGGLCGDAEAQGWCPPEGSVPPRGVHQGQGPAWRQLLYQVLVAKGSKESGPGKGHLVETVLGKCQCFLAPKDGAMIIITWAPNHRLMVRFCDLEKPWRACRARWAPFLGFGA